MWSFYCSVSQSFSESVGVSAFRDTECRNEMSVAWLESNLIRIELSSKEGDESISSSLEDSSKHGKESSLDESLSESEELDELHP